MAINAEWFANQAQYEARQAVSSLNDPGLVHLAKSIEALAQAIGQARKEEILDHRAIINRSGK